MTAYRNLQDSAVRAALRAGLGAAERDRGITAAARMTPYSDRDRLSIGAGVG